MNVTDYWELYFSIHDDNSTNHLYGYYDGLMISTSLVVGVCVNLPALIWACHVLYTLHKHGGQISAFVILLIINDLAELLLSAIIALYVIAGLVKSRAIKSLKVFTEEHIIVNRIILICLFMTFRISGLFLHQLVALKCVLSLKNQFSSAQVFSPLCSTIFCIILWLLVFGFQFINMWYNMILSFLPCFILVITCTLTCNASPAPDHIKPGSAVLIVSTLTLITFYATAGLVLIFKFTYGGFYSDGSGSQLSVYLIRVISDPLLCVLVCKEQLRVHKQQSHTDMNTDQRSVSVEDLSVI